MNSQISQLILVGIVAVTALLSFLAFLVFDAGNLNTIEMYFELVTGLGSGFGGGAVAGIMIGRIYLNTDQSRFGDVHDEKSDNT